MSSITTPVSGSGNTQVPIVSSSYTSSSCASSSTPVPSTVMPTSEIPTVSSPFHLELIRLDLVDKQGKITPYCMVEHALLPLSTEQVAELQQFMDTPIKIGKNDTNITLRECSEILFTDKILSKYIQSFKVIAGWVPKFLTLNYYLLNLINMKVVNPEQYFSDDFIEAWNRKSPDIDFRIFLNDSAGFLLNEAKRSLLGFLREKQGIKKEDASQDDSFMNRRPKLKGRIVTELSRTYQTADALNFSIGDFDFTIYNRLNSHYLGGHNALELPLTPLLDATTPPDEINITPQTGEDEIHPLQAFFDRLLCHLNPHEVLNDAGWIKQMHDLKNGYKIKNIEIWSQLAKYEIQNIKEIPLNNLLCHLFTSCEKSHPSIHPAGIFFTALNAILFFKKSKYINTLNTVWESLEKNNLEAFFSIHPAFESLHSAFNKRENIPQTIPLSVLELCSFIFEVFHHEKDSLSLTSEVTFQGSHHTIGLLWRFPIDMKNSFFLQLKTSPTKAYAALISEESQFRDDPVILEMLCDFLLKNPLVKNENSSIAKHWEALGIDLVALRKTIIANINNPNPSITVLNFVLLAMIHSISPVKASEYRLLELFPLVYQNGGKHQKHLLKTLENTLGIKYSSPVKLFKTTVEQSRHGNSYLDWISSLAAQKDFELLKNFVTLFPRFQQYLPPDLFELVLKRVLETLNTKQPQLAVTLLFHYLQNESSLSISMFTLFCQTLYPHLKNDSEGIIKNNLRQIGEKLLLFFESNLGALKVTQIRSDVLLYILENLLESRHHQLGKNLLDLTTPTHPFYPLISSNIPHIKDKIASSNSENDLGVSQAHRQHQSSIYSKIEKKNYVSAINEFILLFDESSLPTPFLEEILFTLWNNLVRDLELSPKTHLKNIFSIIHNNAFSQKFPEFILEQHLFTLNFLLEKGSSISSDQIQLFIGKAFSQVYEKINPSHQNQYLYRLLQLLPNAWSATYYYSKVFVEEFTKLTSLALNSQEFSCKQQIECVLLLDRFGISFKSLTTTPEQLFYVIVRGLREGSLENHEILALLKIAKKLHQQKQISLPISTLHSLCDCSFQHNLINEGKEWLQILLPKISSDPNFKDDFFIQDFLKWLFCIHSSKKHQLLFSFFPFYHKLDGPTEKFHKFFTDDFIHSSPLKVLEFIDNFSFDRLFSHNPEWGSEIVQKTVKIAFAKQKISDSDKLIILNALLAPYIINAALWLELFKTLEKSNNAEFKVLAFQSLRQAIERGLLNDNQKYRIECWELAVSIPSIMTVTLALEWLRDETELKRIYFQKNETAFDFDSTQRFVASFRKLYSIVGNYPSIEAHRSLLMSHVRLSVYLMSIGHTALSFQLDLILLENLQFQVDGDFYKLFLSNIKSKISIVGEYLKQDHPLINVLTRASKIAVIPSDSPDPTHLFILEIGSKYLHEPWVLQFLCNVTDLRHKDYLEDIIIKILNFFTFHANQNYSEERMEVLRKQFNPSLEQLIQNSIDYPDLIISLVLNSNVTPFLHVKTEDLLKTIIEKWILTTPHPNYQTLQNMMSCFKNLSPYVSKSCHRMIWFSIFNYVLSYYNLSRNSGATATLFSDLIEIHTYEGELAKPLYFLNAEILLKSLSMQNFITNNDASVTLSHSFIHLLLDKVSEDPSFGYLEVFTLVESFCFEFEGSFTQTISKFISCSHDLIDRVDHLISTRPEQFPDVEKFTFLKSITHQKHLVNHLIRLTKSNSSYILNVLMEIVVSSEEINTKLTHAELISVVHSLVSKIEEGDFSLRKYQGEYLSTLASKVIVNLTAQLIATESLVLMPLVKLLATRLLHLKIRLVESDKLSTRTKLNNIGYLVVYLRKLVFLDYYVDNSDEYWGIIHDLFNTIACLCYNNPKELGSVVLAGLMLTEERLIKKVLPISPLAKLIKATICDNFIESNIKIIKDTKNEKHTLELFRDNNWDLMLPKDVGFKKVVELLEASMHRNNRNRSSTRKR